MVVFLISGIFGWLFSLFLIKLEVGGQICSLFSIVYSLFCFLKLKIS